MATETETERALRDGMRSGTHEVRADEQFGRLMVDVSVAALHRRRTRQTVAVGIAAVALTVAAVVLPDSLTRDRGAPADRQTTETPTTRTPPTVSVFDWVPSSRPRSYPGAPAKAGTVMYRTCAGDDCTVTLSRPDGATYDLAQVVPSLAEQLETDGFAGVSLSYDAFRIAHPYENGYASFWLANHSQAPTHSVDAGPTGSVWEVVDWSPWNAASSPLFVRYTDGKVTAFANTNPYTGGRFSTYELNAPTDLLPVADGAASVRMSAPVASESSPRSRVTSPSSHQLWLWPGGDPGLERGQIDWFGPDTTGYSACMAADETLAGPRGVPVQKHASASLRLQDRPLGQISDSYMSTIVYRGVDGKPVPTGVISGDCGGSFEAFGRYDLPQSTADTTWSYLGPITDGESLMIRQESGAETQELMLVGLDLEPRELQSMPAGAEVLAPGMTVPAD